MKILIIEDEKLLADTLQTLLEQKGFDVEAVYDGESGAEYAELGIYDLLILDVMMPKLDGYAVARAVRAKHCGTPILMLTARSGVEDRIAGLNAGADYYLTKPFDTWTFQRAFWSAAASPSGSQRRNLTSCGCCCRPRGRIFPRK